MTEAERKELIKGIDENLESIRPHLAVDGGNIEVVNVRDDMVVEINWVGNCVNCSMSAMTMRAGVEESIKSKFPEITGVVALNGINA